jgi:hypothetical protein
MRVIAAIYRAAQSGGTEKLPEITELDRFVGRRSLNVPGNRENTEADRCALTVGVALAWAGVAPTVSPRGV